MLPFEAGGLAIKKSKFTETEIVKLQKKKFSPWSTAKKNELHRCSQTG